MGREIAPIWKIGVQPYSILLLLLLLLIPFPRNPNVIIKEEEEAF